MCVCEKRSKKTLCQTMKIEQNGKRQKSIEKIFLGDLPYGFQRPKNFHPFYVLFRYDIQFNLVLSWFYFELLARDHFNLVTRFIEFVCNTVTMSNYAKHILQCSMLFLGDDNVHARVLGHCCQHKNWIVLCYLHSRPQNCTEKIIAKRLNKEMIKKNERFNVKMSEMFRT